jgi:hypothetical protein
MPMKRSSPPMRSVMERLSPLRRENARAADGVDPLGTLP